MTEHSGFDINITLSDGARRWSAVPIQATNEPGVPDEFDLDIKYTLPNGAPGNIAPNHNEPGEGKWASGVFGITCGNTCEVGATCTCTCGNTCGITCGNTCQVLATCTCTCGQQQKKGIL